MACQDAHADRPSTLPVFTDLVKTHPPRYHPIKFKPHALRAPQIIDGNVTTDLAMSRLADDCCERVLKGERLYVHCWGGHGRTGTLISTMLGRLYNLPYTTAMRYCQAFHDSRV